MTAACGARDVWGLPADTLAADLAKGTYTALAAVDFSKVNPSDALALSPDAPYYLSFLFDGLGKKDHAAAMLDLAWSRSPSPWKEEAGVLLAEKLDAQKAWDRAADTARRVLAAGPPAPVAEKARRALVEALYWQESDAAVLEEAARLSAPDAEVLLFRAVSSLRLGRAAGHDLVMQLFLDERVSSLHGRVAAFLAADRARLAKFTKTEQDLVTGKNALVQGAWARALPLLEGVLAGEGISFAHTALLADLGASYGYAGRSADGAAFLQKLAARAAGQARADALEQAGKLLRRVKDYGRAAAVLAAASAAATDPAQSDRARWFVLDILLVTAPADLAARLREEAMAWGDREYFSSLLENAIDGWVAARRWTTIASLRAALEGVGPDSIQAQLSYLLARAWQAGLLRALPPGLTARALLEDAVLRDPMGYYGTLAASMLGQVPARAIAGVAPRGQSSGPLDPVALGFLSFGQNDRAYARLWATRDALTDAQLLEAARRFAQAGDLRSSMYFVGALGRRRLLSVEELQMYYPRGYASLLEPLADGAKVPVHVLYGLVREESYFDADIVSSAGAVGLSQLMPATAAGIAKALKYDSPDLRDPVTNLTLGVNHLQGLLRSVDAPTKALLAYNAGLSRVRQWERAAPGYPADLFVESVPLAETRGYVRKILVSAVMYAVLYDGADSRKAALDFFGLRPGALDATPAAPRAGPRTGAEGN